MQYGLIGEHLPHSFSREIHERIGGYSYRLCELAPDELDGFFRAKDFAAINVTIPYKQAVLRYLDETDAAAKAIGAVNTVVNRDGRLIGYNTDFSGMRACLRRYRIGLRDRRVLILGTGGTSRTARALAEAEGAARIWVAGRQPREGVCSYEEAYALGEQVDVLLNTTPVGMYPAVGDCPVSLARFPRLLGVFDAVYNPLRTNLILAARSRGIAAGGGLYMLVCQAVEASALFRDMTLPESLSESVYRDIRSEKENIVLIGMPGSGKSTIGRALSERTGRAFYDSDAEIVQEAGCGIPEIFAREGEESFRRRESAVLARLSRVSDGRIIATGGGAILRGENLRALRRNGRLYFLDRPLDAIHPTADRPLARDRAALMRRYEERYPLYTAAADCRIVVTDGVRGTAEAVLADFSCGRAGPGEGLNV